MPYIAQVQPTDYGARLPAVLANGQLVHAQTSTAIISIMQSAAYVNASHRLWSIWDSGFQQSAWYTYIQPTFSANTPTVNTARPANLP